MQVQFAVVFRDDPEGGYVVSVPDLPEVVTEGDTIEEARRNAEEAILCALEARIDLGMPIPRTQPATSRDATKAGFVTQITFSGSGWASA